MSDLSREEIIASYVENIRNIAFPPTREEIIASYVEGIANIAFPPTRSGIEGPNVIQADRIIIAEPAIDPLSRVIGPNPTRPYEESQNLPNEDYAGTYTSFSGTDAVATLVIPPIGERYTADNSGEVLTLGELQTISYSIHRENSPIRILGRVNPRGFLKGSRTIAGSMIFTVFNEYAFYKIKKYRELLARRNGFYAPLADMLPPFDIILSFVNEYGNISKMKIFGVTIIDEGQTVSIDDLIIEQTYTFMARGIQPLVAFPREEETSTSESDMREINLGISTNIFGDKVTDDIRLLYAKNPIDSIRR